MFASSLVKTIMNQVIEFFQHLFSSSEWPARWHCGYWTDFHGWLYIISDLMIWGAYFAIPLLLFRIIVKRTDIPFNRVFWLFIAFILLCGMTHMLDAVIFWWPAYRLSALLRFITALVSVFTVYALYKSTPSILNLRTIAQLEFEIEERKKAEQEAKTQQLLQQATAELLDKKDEFISVASHELKTPLTSLKTVLQLLTLIVNTDARSEKVPILLNNANLSLNKLSALVEDLLNVTKLEAGQMSITKSSFSLSHLIEDCCSPIRISKPHQLILQGDMDLHVFADKERIDQVIVNLLSNAVKYAPDSDRIMITIERLDDMAKVSVQDFGIGVSADKLPHLFERYYRVDASGLQYSGLGLGLYICSEIIKRHSGQIGANSAFGQGSTFWFTLPVNG